MGEIENSKVNSKNNKAKKDVRSANNSQHQGLEFYKSQPISMRAKDMFTRERYIHNLLSHHKNIISELFLLNMAFY